MKKIIPPGVRWVISLQLIELDNWPFQFQNSTPRNKVLGVLCGGPIQGIKHIWYRHYTNERQGHSEYSRWLNWCLIVSNQGIRPVHARPHTASRSLEQQLCKEIARLVDIGVLEEYYSYEWASPTFAISKKNGTRRVVPDFRKLNSILKCHPFPIPKTEDMIRSMEGFLFATTLDLNMGFITSN